MRHFLLLSLLLIFPIQLRNNQDDKKAIRFENGTELFISEGPDGYSGLKDANGQLIVPMKYKEFKVYGNMVGCLGSQTAKKNYYMAIYTYNGNLIASESEGYSWLSFCKEDGTFFSSAKMTVLDKNGKWIYKYVEKKDSKGFCYLENALADTIVVPPGIYTKFVIQDGYIQTERGNKCGACLYDGSLLMEAKEFGYVAYRPKEGGCRVRYSQYGSGAEGFYDMNGKCIIPVGKYKNFHRNEDGTFNVTTNDGIGLIDSQGNFKLFKKGYSKFYRNKDKDGNEYYIIIRGNATGKMALDGTIIEEPNPSIVRKEHNDNDFIWSEIKNLDGKVGVLNANQNQIIPCEYNMIKYDQSSQGFKLFKDTYEGYANSKGKIIVPADKYDYVTSSYPYKKYEYIEVSINGQYGMLDSNGKVLIQPEWDKLFFATEDLLFVKKDLFYGVMDKTGRIVVPVEFTDITIAGDEYRVGLFMKKGIYTEKNKLVIPPLYTNIQKYPDPISNQILFYHVSDGNTEGLYNGEGKMIFPTGLFETVQISSNPNTIPGYKEDLIVIASNGGGSGKCYYNLKGKLLYDNRNEKEFDSYVQSAHERYERRDYSGAIKYYEKAVSVKKDAISFYNIGAAYYNMSQYRNAIKALNDCISYSRSQSLNDSASDLIIDCRMHIQQRQANTGRVCLGILATVLNVASNVMDANTRQVNYNSAGYSAGSSYYGSSSYSSSESNSTYSSSSYSSSSSSSTNTQSTRRCNYCRGSGWYRCGCESASSFGLEQGYHNCPNCGENHKKGSHSCKCKHCGGTGRI